MLVITDTNTASSQLKFQGFSTRTEFPKRNWQISQGELADHHDSNCSNTDFFSRRAPIASDVDR